jgi:hypothetical protein
MAVVVVCVGLSGRGGHSGLGGHGGVGGLGGLGGLGGFGGLGEGGVGMKGGDCMSRRALGLYLSTWRYSVLAEVGCGVLAWFTPAWVHHDGLSRACEMAKASSLP